jgi:DhnA family fructose-bisphosphate aldolase class Ia
LSSRERLAIGTCDRDGSIIGRNTFQRPRADALAMLARIIAIYKNEE